jgi:uncharacterized DUF497 family protein
MAHATEKRVVQVGKSSRGVIIPKPWLKNKTMIGVIAFDLESNEEKKEYEQLRSQMTWR